jgi:CheY-like chemotaxis protein
MATILVIEDNEMNLDMLARRLERRGFRVLSAVDGEAGIQMTFEHQPDLILLDMSLPVIDGWEAARQIRAAQHQMPIIALTAHAVSGDKERCLEAGCSDYEPKPIDFASLMTKIDAWLSS